MIRIPNSKVTNNVKRTTGFIIANLNHHWNTLREGEGGGGGLEKKMSGRRKGHASVSIPNASMNMQKIFKINIFENVENTEAGVGVSP